MKKRILFFVILILQLHYCDHLKSTNVYVCDIFCFQLADNWGFSPFVSKSPQNTSSISLFYSQNSDDFLSEGNVENFGIITLKDSSIHIALKTTIQDSLKPKIKKCNLAITSNPSGAYLFLNEKKMGKTPFKKEIKPGIYTLRLELDSYQVYRDTLDLTTQSVFEEYIKLEIQTGVMFLNTNPEGASIAIDKVNIQRSTPFTVKDIAIGEHKFRFVKDFHMPFDTVMTVSAIKEEIIVIDLVPLYGEIEVFTEPASDIYINNKKVGNSYIRRKLLAGKYSISSKQKLHHDAQSEINIAIGDKKKIQLNLTPKHGVLNLTSKPKEAKIYIDDVFVGKCPMKIDDIFEGEYEVKFTKHLYGDVIERVSIKENEEFDLNAKLPSHLGVYFNSFPDGGDVYIDSVKIGIAPMYKRIAYGKRIIKVIKNGVERVKHITINQKADSVLNFIVAKTELDMIFVSGGEFMMGSNEGESDEIPPHKVELNSFYISKYEVTHEEFIKFLNQKKVNRFGGLGNEVYLDMQDKDCAVGYRNGKFYFKGSKFALKANCPLIEVQWHGANAYCRWAGGRLPTEAEWEYAARGGVKSKGYKYAGSNRIEHVAEYDGNSLGATTVVGTKRPNELGIYDMTGNVYEWCHDWYEELYYSSSMRKNPMGPKTGVYKVFRGGSWCIEALYSRVAYRNCDEPSSGGNTLGFRLVVPKVID